MHRPSLYLTLSLLAATGTLAECNKPTVRRDWRSLTDAERTHFIDVQQQLWRQEPDPDTGLSVYDVNFTTVHRDNTPFAHQVAAFLPWHRRFLRDYETALRTIDPEISLPYWNWAADNTRLNESAIWGDKYFGADGADDDNHFVQIGRYANWTLKLGGDLSDPNVNKEHFLRRIWTRGISAPRQPGQAPAVPNEDEIAGNITEVGTDFDAFRRWFEPHHGTIHQGVGGFSMEINGDMTAVENSPNEPVFWLHHAFVDRTWWQFQQQGAEARSAYGGKPNENAALPKDDPVWTDGAKVSDLLSPWKVTAESAMYTDADDYCYTYE
jgi:tyrosinase